MNALAIDFANAEPLTFDQRPLARPEARDGGDASPVFVAKGQVKSQVQHIMDMQLGQLFGDLRPMPLNELSDSSVIQSGAALSCCASDLST